MRNYGVVRTYFWYKECYRGISVDLKLLLVYLHTNEHTTSLGCFRLPPTYMADELEWPLERVIKAIEDATASGLLYFSEYETGWFYLPVFLKWNPIVNRNQWVGLKRVLNQVPGQLPFYPKVIKAVLQDVQYILEDDRIELEKILEHCMRSETVSGSKTNSNNIYSTSQQEGNN